MADKTYKCAYKYCLHNNAPVEQAEAVMSGKRYYHWDCIAQKQEIKRCVDLYMSYIEDKTKYPMVTRIINNLVFSGRVPVDFIFTNISRQKLYYQSKPVQMLYGLRKLFWEGTIKNC